MSASTASAQDDEYIEQVVMQLEAASEIFMDEGYEPLVWEGSVLEDGESELYTVTLTEGYTYVLVGVCDADCTDIDLTMFDGYDNLIVEDIEVDDAPVIEFEVTSGGEFTLDVTMFDCDADICYYGVALFEW